MGTSPTRTSINLAPLPPQAQYGSVSNITPAPSQPMTFGSRTSMNYGNQAPLPPQAQYGSIANVTSVSPQPMVFGSRTSMNYGNDTPAPAQYGSVSSIMNQNQ